MFRGIYSISLDEKGRFLLPARYSKSKLINIEINNELIITIDIKEQCLLIYPWSEWEVIEKKIEQLPNFNDAARRIQRLLLGHATEVSLDNQNRILLPQPLREYAKLDKQIVLVGQGRKLELWSQSLWQQQRDSWIKNQTLDLERLPKNLQRLSL